MTDTCNVIFRGDIAPGFTAANVRQALKDFFSLDDTRINQLFSGRPVTIKKNLEREKAIQFQTLLVGMGAMAEIVVAAAAEINPQASPAKAPQVVAAVPVPVIDRPASGSSPASDPVMAGATISIAPPGADVLKPEERNAVTHREIVTDHLSLDSPGADVLKPHERKQTQTLELDLSHITVEPADDLA